MHTSGTVLRMPKELRFRDPLVTTTLYDPSSEPSTVSTYNNDKQLFKSCLTKSSIKNAHSEQPTTHDYVSEIETENRKLIDKLNMKMNEFDEIHDDKDEKSNSLLRSAKYKKIKEDVIKILGVETFKKLSESLIKDIGGEEASNQTKSTKNTEDAEEFSKNELALMIGKLNVISHKFLTERKDLGINVFNRELVQAYQTEINQILESVNSKQIAFKCSNSDLI